MAERTEAASFEDATWSGSRLRRLLDGLAATPEQRLAWLEEAIALAFATGALPRKGDERAEPPRGPADARRRAPDR
jgi:hypothetical protein